MTEVTQQQQQRDATCLPCSSAGKESACNVGNLGLILGWVFVTIFGSNGDTGKRELKQKMRNLFECLENPMDGGAW